MKTVVDWKLSDRITISVIDGELFSEGPRIVVDCDGDAVARGSGTPKRLEPFLDALDELVERLKQPLPMATDVRIERNGDAFEVWHRTKPLGLIRNVRIVELLRDLLERGDFWKQWKAAIEDNQRLETKVAALEAKEKPEPESESEPKPETVVTAVCGECGETSSYTAAEAMAAAGGGLVCKVCPAVVLHVGDQKAKG